MKKYNIGIIVLCCATTILSCTKNETEEKPTPITPSKPQWDPEVERGYYDAPYKRYEAELLSGCVGQCIFLEPSDCISDIQSEASNQIAAQLVAHHDYVEWACTEAADGMVIRFSIPDAPQGGGTTGLLTLSVNGVKVRDIELNSYWAWQYKDRIAGQGNYYFDNMPGSGKYARMRFDELRVRLDEKIPTGAIFRLEKSDDNSIPYTIDFVELEPIPAPITYESVLNGTNVCYNPLTDGPLYNFVIINAGRTIFLPAGKYDVKQRIWLTANNTRIIGAGTWYTEIYFSADPNNQTEYGNRGFYNEGGSGCSIENLYINTANERRYFDYQGGIPMGKGIEGSWGDGAKFKNLWIEHFECGAWISYAKNLLITQCRMRNNYADGINICGSSSDCIVENSDFRNNGDDNVASWSSSQEPATNLIFRHLTSELGWRAGGIGIFGGRNHHLHNLLIRDQCESGLRIVTDFVGAGFNDKDYITVEKTTITNSGSRSGAIGEYGNIGGGEAGALELSSCNCYNLHNVKCKEINIINAKWSGVLLDSGNGYKMTNIYLENICVDGWLNKGITFNNAKGSVFYRNFIFKGGSTESQQGPLPDGFTFEQF